MSGSVRGVPGNRYPYRDLKIGYLHKWWASFMTPGLSVFLSSFSHFPQLPSPMTPMVLKLVLKRLTETIVPFHTIQRDGCLAS